MSSTVFHPGGLVTPEPGPSGHPAARLMPGERAVPLQVLEAHWAGDRAALDDWLRGDSDA